jgi:hypothetical protein
MKKVTIHLEIGPVMIITYGDESGFFWLDRRTQQGAGPFNFKSTALEHFAEYDKTNRKLQIVPPRYNVITIDFQNKRRVK